MAMTYATLERKYNDALTKLAQERWLLDKTSKELDQLTIATTKVLEGAVTLREDIRELDILLHGDDV